MNWGTRRPHRPFFNKRIQKQIANFFCNQRLDSTTKTTDSTSKPVLRKRMSCWFLTSISVSVNIFIVTMFAGKKRVIIFYEFHIKRKYWCKQQITVFIQKFGGCCCHVWQGLNLYTGKYATTFVDRAFPIPFAIAKTFMRPMVAGSQITHCKWKGGTTSEPKKQLSAVITLCPVECSHETFVWNSPQANQH